VLEMMRELGIPKGVYTSSVAIFSDTHGQKPDESFHFTGRHITVYDQTKAEAHAIAESFIRDGLPLVIVQPSVVYGPGDTSNLGRTIRQYLRRQLPLLPIGTAFCWVHVEDAARGHLLAMEKGRPGESYILAGPSYRVTAFFDMAAEITGVPAPRLRLPPGAMKFSAALMGVIEKVVPVPESYSSEYIRDNAGVTYMGDNSKARRELGFEPRPLREGMEETLKYEMERMKKRE